MKTTHYVIITLIGIVFFNTSYAQKPEAENKNPIVIIDPGHGGIDAGAVANIVPSVSGSGSNELDSNELDSNELDSNELGNNESGNKEQDSSDPDTQSDSFTLAPLGSDVSDTADTAEDQPSNVSIDHLGLEPVGSNIVEQEERETIEPVEVDTSHLSLE